MKPSLKINVGITGHRNIDANENQELEKICNNILGYITKCTLDIYEQAKNFYKSDPPVFRLLTLLAEGFDRTAVYPALELNYEIQCPLPFSRKDYLEDFETEESKDEFLSLLNKATAVYELDHGRAYSEKAYLSAGIVMLEHTDILIAFWDGQPSRGTGGTADIIELALDNGILVIHIDRNFTISSNNNLSWKTQIRKFIEGELIPYRDNDMTDSFPAVYFSEENDQKNSVQLYNHIIELFSPKTKNKKDKKAKNKEVCDGIKNEQTTKLRQYFKQYLEVADNLAKFYSNQYRSAGMLKCLLPLFATIALAFGFYWDWSRSESIINVIGFLLQAVFLYIMARFIGINTDKNKWHQKFIDYRILAECLRYKPYLMNFGITLRHIKISEYNRNASLSWINWYMRGIVRDYGLPNEVININFTEDSLEVFKNEILNSQRNYHKGKAEKLRLVAKRIEKLGLVFFTVGAAVTLIRVIIHYIFISSNIEWFPSIHDKWIRIPTFFNLLSLLLPAIGSVFATIESQAGFNRLSERDTYMVDQIDIFINEFDELENKSFLTKRKWMTNVTEAMIDEVSDWRVFLKSKTISRK